MRPLNVVADMVVDHAGHRYRLGSDGGLLTLELPSLSAVLGLLRSRAALRRGLDRFGRWLWVSELSMSVRLGNREIGRTGAEVRQNWIGRALRLPGTRLSATRLLWAAVRA